MRERGRERERERERDQLAGAVEYTDRISATIISILDMTLNNLMVRFL